VGSLLVPFVVSYKHPKKGVNSMKRTKLADRILPIYSREEETVNMVTHIIGSILGIIVLGLCVTRSAMAGSIPAVIASTVYGLSMIALYTMSSVYHGMRPCLGKKVMQVLDHCTIYFLIAGSYTPVLVCSMIPVFPVIGWGLLIFVWSLAILAATLTAIDLKAYKVFSMICYIGMGWAIIFFIPQLLQVMSSEGFALLLAGGIAYTIGAILYGIGKKKPWMHSVFHVFVVLGSLLQFLCIYLHVL